VREFASGFPSPLARFLFNNVNLLEGLVTRLRSTKKTPQSTDSNAVSEASARYDKAYKERAVVADTSASELKNTKHKADGSTPKETKKKLQNRDEQGNLSSISTLSFNLMCAHSPLLQ
jgi:hypothetical protein